MSTIDPKMWEKLPGWMPGAGLNVGHHALDMLKGMGTAVTHPGETAQGVADAADAVSDRTKKALGMPYNRASAGKADQMYAGMVAPYTAVGPDGKRHFDVKQTYNTFKTDPGRPLEDASMVLPMVGDIAAGGRAAALAGNMSRTADVLGNVAKATRTVGEVANPLYLPTKGAAAIASKVKPLSTAGNLIAQAQGMKTGVGPKATTAWFDQARQAANGNDLARREFLRGQAGGDKLADEALNRVKAHVQNERAAASADYVAKKGNLATAPADFTHIQNTVDQEAKAAGLGSKATRRPDGSIDLANSDPGFSDRQKALFKAKEIIDDHFTSPDPSKQSILGLDTMKQKLDELFSEHPTATGPLKNIKDAVKATANGIDPDYEHVLGGYSDDLASINGFAKDMGASGKTSPTAALNKLLRNMKSSTNGDLIDRMAQSDPGLPHLLAGMQSRPWFGGGLTMHGLDGLATGVGALAMNPHLIGGALLNEAASSPRLTSGINSLAGRAVGTLDKAAPVAEAAGKAGDAVVRGAGRVAPLLDTDRSSPDDSAPVDPSQLDHPVAGEGPVDPSQLDHPAAGHPAEDTGMPPGYDASGNEIGHPAAAPMAAPHAASTHTPAAEDTGMPPGYDKDGNEIAEPAPRTSGGRVAFARGGKIDDGHERLVNRLMRMAEQAKKASNEVTEPLLKAPDEHIVKALAIAQKAI